MFLKIIIPIVHFKNRRGMGRGQQNAWGLGLILMPFSHIAYVFVVNKYCKQCILTCYAVKIDGHEHFLIWGWGYGTAVRRPLVNMFSLCAIVHLKEGFSFHGQSHS